MTITGGGAVTAAMRNAVVPGQISILYSSIRPAIAQAGQDLEAAIKANAGFQAGLLKNASPVIADLVKQGKLLVVAAYYDLASGKVTRLS